MASDTVTITTRPYHGLETALEQYLADHGEPERIQNIWDVQLYFTRGWEVGKAGGLKIECFQNLLQNLGKIYSEYIEHAFDHGWEAAKR